MPPGRAPADAVGGPQESGPWPENVEEIVAGDTYGRTIPTPSGDASVQATVSRVDDLGEGGYVVAFTHASQDGGA